MTMDKLFLSLSVSFLCSAAMGQITITQADLGQAGDSIVVGYDEPAAGMSVGGTGLQSWNYSFAVNDINTLKFEFVANTASGAYFPNANMAIERQTDTMFFKSSSGAFVLDGITGDAFGLGASLVADFDPDATQLLFPSTYLDAFTDTAVFDTTVSCAAFGQGSLCDSARLRRMVILTSVINAYGTLQTSGGTYTTIRQYLREENHDSVAVLNVIFGNPVWSTVVDSVGIAHNYRWFANGEKWPVLTARADAAGGDIVYAEFKVDDNLLGYITGQQDPACFDGCDGSATVSGLGGVPPYSYQWPASAGSQTTASATGLCAGTHVVTITDNNAQSVEVTVEIDEPEALVIAGAVQGVSMGNDGAIDITVSGGTGVGTYTYGWTGPNGFTASTADISGIEEGDYTVTVTDNNDCDTNRMFTVALTGIGSIATTGFNMYPNPANNSVRIAAEGSINNIAITDLLGNKVGSYLPGSPSIDIMTRELNSGIYMVEVQTDKGTYLRKLTVQH